MRAGHNLLLAVTGKGMYFRLC